MVSGGQAGYWDQLVCVENFFGDLWADNGPSFVEYVSLRHLGECDNQDTA